MALLGVVSAISGTVVFLIGLHDALLVRRLRQHGIRTSGLVAGQTQEDTDSGSHQKPIISFADQHGRAMTFQPSASGKGFELPTGQEVPVVYLADNPKKVRVDTPGFMTLQPLFLLFLGLVILGAAIAVFVTAS